MSTDTADKPTSTAATIYRMVMPGHTCPYGFKTLDLLQREGFEVDDVHLEPEHETKALRDKWDVENTPQTFVDGELVGTLDDVRESVGRKRKDGSATTHWPVLTLFTTTFLMERLTSPETSGSAHARSNGSSRSQCAASAT